MGREDPDAQAPKFAFVMLNDGSASSPLGVMVSPALSFLCAHPVGQGLEDVPADRLAELRQVQLRQWILVEDGDWVPDSAGSEIPSCVLLSLYFNKLIFIHLIVLYFDYCAPNTAQWLARRRSTPSLSD